MTWTAAENLVEFSDKTLNAILALRILHVLYGHGGVAFVACWKLENLE